MLEPTVSAEPAALTAQRELKLGAPLKSPQCAHKEYLPAIFTAVLNNNLCWSATWLSQALSAAAWLQVALLSDYYRGTVMRAMHRAVAKAYCTLQGTALHTGHSQKTAPFVLPHAWVAAYIALSLGKHAFWAGDAYSS